MRSEFYLTHIHIASYQSMALPFRFSIILISTSYFDVNVASSTALSTGNVCWALEDWVAGLLKRHSNCSAEGIVTDLTPKLKRSHHGRDKEHQECQTCSMYWPRADETAKTESSDGELGECSGMYDTPNGADGI